MDAAAGDIYNNEVSIQLLGRDEECRYTCDLCPGYSIIVVKTKTTIYYFCEGHYDDVQEKLYTLDKQKYAR